MSRLRRCLSKRTEGKVNAGRGAEDGKGAGTNSVEVWKVSVSVQVAVPEGPEMEAFGFMWIYNYTQKLYSSGGPGLA